MGRYADEYRSKLRTPDEAVKVVKSDDWVYYSHFAMMPRALDEALAKRVGEVSNVNIRCVSPLRQPSVVAADPEKKSFIYNSGHMSGIDRKLGDKGLCYYIPGNYGRVPINIRNGYMYRPNVLFVVTAPMDKNGFFNFGAACSYMRAASEMADYVVVEVNEHAPVCLGGEQESIHISEVDFIVEHSAPLPTIPAEFEATEVDKAIAGHILEHIEDGACLQLGIGGMPNTVGKMIADSDLKDLGIHSEMMADAFVDLFEKGKVTGARKNLDKYKMVYTFALGSQKLYEFIDSNPLCATYPVDLTNSPERIAMNDKVIAINNAVEIDLYGQVNSESSGFRNISGTGGQLDFIIGALNSRGGKGFICLSSTTTKNGQRVSRIVPWLSPGSIVSVPRSYSSYVVTEYGVANIMGKSTYRKAEMLIEIAHPDFRDELIKAAAEQRIWTRTNRIE